MKSLKWDGHKITQPGMYSDTPIDEYHGQRICDGPSVSSSGLRRVLEINGGSPAHFYAESSLNPTPIESEEKKQFVLGRAAHHLLLGQPNFSKLFVVSPYENFRTKEAREWRDGMRASGRTVLTQDDVDTIRGMSLSLGQHPLVAGGILGGDIERSLFWKDKETGIWLKSRPDAIPTDSGDAADLKTVASVQWLGLMRSISDYAYHQQAALVREGMKACCGVELATFSLVFVEKKAPWCVRIVMLKDEDIALGHQQNRRALKLIAKCINENRWPGPGDDHVTHIDLMPKYREMAEDLVK